MAVNPKKRFYSSSQTGLEIAQEIAEIYGFSVSYVLQHIDDGFCEEWVSALIDIASNNDSIVDRQAEVQAGMISDTLGDGITNLITGDPDDLAKLKEILAYGDVPESALENAAYAIADLSDDELNQEGRAELSGMLLNAGLDLSTLKSNTIARLGLSRGGVKSAAKKTLGRSRVESLVISLA